MSDAIRITPESLAAEMADHARRLAAGLPNLFQVGGVESGVTASEVVYREDKLTLRHYSPPPGVPRNPVPLMIVYALVNRPYMLDLQEDRSTIRNLLAAGQEVYLVDWGYPDEADAFLALEDYIDGYMDRCIDRVRRLHGLDRINLLGVCQGGSFSLCYTALHPGKVRNLVTMVTPVDFQTPDNLLSAWVQAMDVDLLVDTLGNIPGELLNWTFLSLKPFALTGQKYLHLLDLLEDPRRLKNFLRMEKWIFDSPDQAGEAFRQFIQWFYQRNGLIGGTLEIGGRRVDLGEIRCPLLNVYGEQDHLVPPDASRALRGRTGSDDYTEIAFPGGHIGIYVSGRAQKQVTPAVADWLDRRSR